MNPQFTPNRPNRPITTQSRPGMPSMNNPRPSPMQNNVRQQLPQVPFNRPPMTPTSTVNSPNRPNNRPPSISRPNLPQNVPQNRPPMSRPTIPQNRPTGPTSPTYSRPGRPRPPTPNVYNQPTSNRPQSPMNQYPGNTSPQYATNVPNTNANQYGQPSQQNQLPNQVANQYSQPLQQNQQNQPNPQQPSQFNPVMQSNTPIVENTLELQSDAIQCAPIAPNVPILLYVQPLNKHFTTSHAIIRCRRCRTYLNCYCVIKMNKWQCNCCQLFNQLETNDPLLLKPILSSNSVEYFAPQEYMIRPPMATTWYIVSDDLKVFKTLLNALPNMPHSQHRLRVGLVYSCSDTIMLTSNGLMIFNDVEDELLCPKEELLLSIYNGTEINTATLELIQDFIEECSKYQSRLAQSLVMDITPILSLMIYSLKSSGGSIIHHFRSPTTVSKSKQLALDASRCHIGISGYTNCKNDLNHLSQYTGGCLFPISTNTIESPSHLYTFLCQSIALESVLRIRTISNLKAVQYYGQFFTRSSDLLAIANVHPNNTYIIEYTIEEQLVDQFVYFQCALLHTSDEGDRRIRVLTNKVPVVTTTIALQQINPMVICSWLSRKALELQLMNSIDAIGHKTTSLCVLMKQNQVMLNKTFTLLILGLCKNLFLIHLNKAEFSRIGMNGWCLDALYQHCYPKILSLTTIDPQSVSTIELKDIQILPSSTQHLTHDGLYLIQTPLVWCIWMSRDCTSPLLNAYASLSSGHWQKDMGFSLHTLINRYLLIQLQDWMVEPQLYLIKETGDPLLRQMCLWLFVLDKSPNTTEMSESKYYLLI